MDVERQVIEIVSQQLGLLPERIKLESRFKEDFGADSLDCVELVMELEEEFDIVLDDKLALETQTVGQAIAAINTQLTGVKS